MHKQRQLAGSGLANARDESAFTHGEGGQCPRKPPFRKQGGA